MNKAPEFEYDVFLSHTSKDKPAVRELAERLRADGLRVWFDEWLLKPGDSIPAKIEDGLERSRVLVLCMSAHAFGSDWPQLESSTFRFRDPLNHDRRFIPLRLDDAPIQGSLAQFLYINWLPQAREQEYPKLLEACHPPATLPDDLSGEASAKTEALAKLGAEAEREQVSEKAIGLDYNLRIQAIAFSQDRKRVLTGARQQSDHTMRLWDVETGRCLCVFEGHTDEVWSMAWSADQGRVISGSWDNTMRLWEPETGCCLRVFQGHTAVVWHLAWSADQRHVLSVSDDKTVRLWQVETGRCLRVFEGHSDQIKSVAWSPDERHALSGASDNTARLWEIESGRCLRVLEGHTDGVWSVVWSSDGRRALSGSKDVRLWDVETGRCLRVIKGHTSVIPTVAWSADQRRAISCSRDHTVRLWDVETGCCLRVLQGHTEEVITVVWSADGRRALSGDSRGGIRVWDLSEFVTEARATEVTAPSLPPAPEQVQYTNAKVLLVGDTSAGKTGLSMRLASGNWKPSDSTVGAWATHWKLPVPEDAIGASSSSPGQDAPAIKDNVEREIWLWDFGG